HRKSGSPDLRHLVSGATRASLSCGAIHVLVSVAHIKTWMPGTRPGMTKENLTPAPRREAA
ncbi:MAG: hypothetical protein F9K38_00660, partial [Pseudorhodoplanes sp.]